MLFNSAEFAVFLVTVLAIYYILSLHAQNIFLIVASYFFYCWWDWRFAVLLAFITILNYFCALGITIKSRQRYFLWICITGNLAALGFFKYFNFFVNSLSALLSQFGLQTPLPTLNIILPVGISFYTLQSMAYAIDVYREKIPAVKNFVSLAAFFSFFPQLLAGPIERAEHMLPQFQKTRSVDSHMFSRGAVLIFIGLFKKIAIADAVAAETNMVFSNISTTPWPELLGGLWYFTIQLYCDFSGYSDIARGTAFLLGFELMENFNQPLLAANITDYWRRWHISLSSWLRDYLYIPLGGNRQGSAKTYRNIFLTMMICGLWHGANWTYVLWGTINGVYLTIYRAMLHGKKAVHNRHKNGLKAKIKYVCSVFLLFNLLSLPWLFFRAETLTEAMRYLQRILFLQGSFSIHGFYFCKLAFFMCLVLLIDIPQYISRDHTAILKWPWVLQGVVYGIMIISIILLAPGNEIPFIYFQF